MSRTLASQLGYFTATVLKAERRWPRGKLRAVRAMILFIVCTCLQPVPMVVRGQTPAREPASATHTVAEDALTLPLAIDIALRTNPLIRATASGQYPAAVILSCIDSRAPAEIIFDARLGDTFNARVAGNIADDDLLGSMEFACAVAGAKVVLVMGHTSCGAIKGAIDGAQLGHLTGLLNKIKPAVEATRYEGARTSKNDAFVDEVAKTNVRQTVSAIRQRSEVLAGLEKEGKIKIVGSMYRLVGGGVDFFT